MAERERASEALEGSLDDALTLARDQLGSVNQRAERLESLLEARDAELTRLRNSAEAAAEDARAVRDKLDLAMNAHQAERDKQEERHAASESRWMIEVDRARQSLKEAVRERDRQVKDIHGQWAQLQTQRDEYKREANITRLELRAAVKANVDLEKRLTSLTAYSAHREHGFQAIVNAV